jgi:ABC-2 type transport system permease protein/oleandomycin transport system permease protein
MTAVEDALEIPPRLPFGAAFSDALVVAGRFLRQLVRTPQLVVFTIVQNLLFLTMFRYVFGGSIHIPGLAYVDYIIPAFLAQIAVWDGFAIAVGTATDAQAGLIERFRALPMARSAFLLGRALSDALRQAFLLCLMLGVGVLMGFGFHAGFFSVLAALGLALLFGFALFWFYAWIGISVSNPETAQAAATPVIIFSFISTAFVRVNTLPGWLQDFARDQPVSQVMNAMRGLMEGPSARALVEHSTGHYVLTSVLWCVGIIAVSATLAIRAFRKA